MTEDHVKNMRNGQVAYAAACRKIIQRHPDEWALIYGDERVALGLPRLAGNHSKRTEQQVAGLLERAQARVDALQSELRGFRATNS